MPQKSIWIIIKSFRFLFFKWECIWEREYKQITSLLRIWNHHRVRRARPITDGVPVILPTRGASENSNIGFWRIETISFPIRIKLKWSSTLLLITFPWLSNQTRSSQKSQHTPELVSAFTSSFQSILIQYVDTTIALISKSDLSGNQKLLVPAKKSNINFSWQFWHVFLYLPPIFSHHFPHFLL